MSEDRAKYHVNLAPIEKEETVPGSEPCVCHHERRFHVEGMGCAIRDCGCRFWLPRYPGNPDTFHDSEEVVLLKEIRQLLVDLLALQWRLIQTVENAHVSESERKTGKKVADG